ncbi:leukotriene C4 synthase [Colossoma macropomum]|uniref:leukotriene C4 synthase n=1 Tax=Colossoma macropomum TaxID=42526 RepID=UPI001863BE33|nr:leukotriene C4 synthase [Colossoma macropomum]XP_036423806.1 leukotriene C4 synthase [Colossoma macropomum]
MLDEVVCVAAVTVLGVLEQAYFSLQVIYARRKYSVPPPATTGPPEFERVFRAQANCSEYFPLFVVTLWVAGLFFSQAVSVVLGLLYLHGRYRYFHGYAKSAQGRLAPLYFSAKVQWVLIAVGGVGVLCCMSRLYVGFDPLASLCNVLGLSQLD